MKSKIKIEEVQSCIKSGITSATKISKILGYSVSGIFSFCKNHGIILDRAKSGGHNLEDMTGKVYNGVKVLCRIEQDSAKRHKKLASWKCLCPCGQEFTSVGTDIRMNRVKTCGCKISIVSKRNWDGFGLIPKRVWSTIKRNAHNRNIPVSISIEYINGLLIQQKQLCALSGIPISFSKNNNTASLDRIDSSIGYTEGNVWWVHKDINFMKQSFSVETLFTHAKNIYLTLRDKYEHTETID